MTTDNDNDAAADLARWDRHETEAHDRAMAALHDDITADELVEVVRRLAADVREIPARIRVAEAAHDIATELVAVLEDAGVAFADHDTAPDQIAGSIMAAWMEADGRTADTVDWLAVAACVPHAVQWARWNAGGAEPGACEAIRRLVEDRAR